MDRDEAREYIYELIRRSERKKKLWTPLPGPQTLAYQSLADDLFYGGSAGGGKTDLGLGLAYREHWRSIVFRRVFPSLGGIIDRSREIYNPDRDAASKDSYNEQLHRWKFHDGRQVRFGTIQHDKDVLDWQGQPFDLYFFDELPEFTEAMFRYVTSWNRSARTGQRCRTVSTGNPPTTVEGEWVVDFWGPWLKEDHPRPAKPGELRYFTMINGKEQEVADGSPIEVVDEKTGKVEIVTPRSRTFIPASVYDNPHLLSTGYVARLQALPEPLRSKFLRGDWRAGREDDAYQVIPSEWVLLAQQRWKETIKPDVPMSMLGVDVARGGRDKTVLTPRYANWIGEQVCLPGKSTPDGPATAAFVLTHRRNNAPVNIDVIGVGTAPYDSLKGVLRGLVAPLNGAEAADDKARDKSGQLMFVNKRAQWWWQLREALDPVSGQNLALPPDAELRSDLCAPKWKLMARGIQVESKDDIIKRLGRSPDKGDSLVYAVAEPRSAVVGQYVPVRRDRSGRTPFDQGGHAGVDQDRDFDNDGIPSAF